MVREINFNNAEEITEEGLPLMILFHKQEDTKSLETFTQAAQRWLFSQKGKINVVTAICEQVSYQPQKYRLFLYSNLHVKTHIFVPMLIGQVDIFRKQRYLDFIS